MLRADSIQCNDWQMRQERSTSSGHTHNKHTSPLLCDVSLTPQSPQLGLYQPFPVWCQGVQTFLKTEQLLLVQLSLYSQDPPWSKHIYIYVLTSFIINSLFAKYISYIISSSYLSVQVLIYRIPTWQLQQRENIIALVMKPMHSSLKWASSSCMHWRHGSCPVKCSPLT